MYLFITTKWQKILSSTCNFLLVNMQFGQYRCPSPCMYYVCIIIRKMIVQCNWLMDQMKSEAERVLVRLKFRELYRKWRWPSKGDPLCKMHKRLVHRHWSNAASWLITLIMTKLDEFRYTKWIKAPYVFCVYSSLARCWYKQCPNISAPFMCCCIWARVQA